MSVGLLYARKLSVTSFYGGVQRGPCLQLTLSEAAPYTQLDFTEVEELAQTLNAWLRGMRATGGEDEVGVVP